MKKGLTIALIMSLIMSFSSIGVFADLVDPSNIGQYQTINWSYNAESKTLIIGGYGTIPSYNTEGLGYTEYKNEIEHVEMMSITGNSTFEIGDKAFYGFKNMKSFRCASNVTKIGKNAFERCSSLESFEMPDRVTEIGAYAFSYCSNLESLELSNRLTTLPNGFIDECDSLEYLEIPESVTSLEKYAFMSNSLTSITLPEGITDIPSYAFLISSKLKTVYLPNSIKRISDEAFPGCSKLESVYYDGTLEQWEQIEIYEDSWSTHKSDLGKAHLYYDFYGSYPVAESEVVQSGTDWESDVSWTLTANGLLTFSGEGEITDYPNYNSAPWLKYRDSIKCVVIEEGVTKIGSYAFFSCHKMKRLEIPNTVTSIGNSAFYGASELKIVWIGSGLTAVGKYAFTGADNIKTIIYNGLQNDWEAVNITGTGNDIFDKTDIICNSTDDRTTPTPSPTPTPESKFEAKAKAYKKTIAYSWNKVDGAKKYRVYMAKGKSKSFKWAATTKTALSTKVKGLKRHSSYKAYVVALNKNGKQIGKTQTIKVKTK